jgi:pimeloyl-ACP methyl ester carboxylesterase
MSFRVRDAGPTGGTPVVLLHGFPETSRAWDAVAPLLHEHGYRTLAPDLRGYSPGARPRGARHYRLDTVAGDVLALLDAARIDRAHLVGHDWGGALAWQLAGSRPGRLRTLTAVSTPHPAAMAWAMRHSTQFLKSLYMGFFNLPRVPEYVLRKGIERDGLRSLGLPEAQRAAYAAALLEPGALEAALGWYRAIRTRPRPKPAPPVTIPTTYVWGRRDKYLGRAAAERTGQYCEGPYELVELDADHWIPEKHPDELAGHILARLG